MTVLQNTRPRKTGPGVTKIRAFRAGPLSIRVNVRVMVVAGLLILGTVAAMALHVAFGGTPMAYPDVLRALLGDESNARIHLAVTEFRAPRMVAAVVVGHPNGGTQSAGEP
jgi:iron complex transport system permease protein